MRDRRWHGMARRRVRDAFRGRDQMSAARGACCIAAINFFPRAMLMFGEETIEGDSLRPMGMIISVTGFS